MRKQTPHSAKCSATGFCQTPGFTDQNHGLCKKGGGGGGGGGGHYSLMNSFPPVNYNTN